MNNIEKDLSSIKLKSLIDVILYSGILSILLGYLIGFIDYYLGRAIHISLFPLMFFLTAYWIGGQVRRQYLIPHIVYIVITGIFMTILAIIAYSFPSIYQTVVSVGQPSLIFHVKEYSFILGLFFQMLVQQFSFNLLLDLLIVVVGIYVGIRRTY